MKQLQIAVCDDERFARDTIASAVMSIFQEQQIRTEIQCFASAAELLEYCGTQTPDLLFLDIEMPEMNGLKLGRRMHELSEEVEIIYVSNREDAVFQALKVHPFGFVRKGNFMKDLQDITRAYIAHLNKKWNEKKVVVMTSQGYESFKASDIRYFEGSGTYQRMFVKGKDTPIQIRSRMMNLEKELEEEGFLRIHKGYLVNFQYISRISATEVLMDQKEVLPISRGKGQELKSRFLKLSREHGNMLF